MVVVAVGVVVIVVVSRGSNSSSEGNCFRRGRCSRSLESDLAELAGI